LPISRGWLFVFQLLAYRAITALSAIAVFIAAVHLMILKKAPQRMQRYKGASFSGSHLCLQSVMMFFSPAKPTQVW
jgi:hypothetical protein